MTDDPTRRFYDDLAEVYHLIFADWEASVVRQGRALAGLLREPPRRRLPPRAFERPLREVGADHLEAGAGEPERLRADPAGGVEHPPRRRPSLAIDFRPADLRALSAVHRPGFDVVLAGDNSIAHLQTDDEILAALGEMRALLPPGGGCCVSVRDYAAIDRESTRMLSYGARETPAGRVFVFQSWDFVDVDHYDLGLFFVHDTADRPRTEVFRCRCYAIPLDRLEGLFRTAGFADVEVLRDCYYQPLVVGTEPGVA